MNAYLDRKKRASAGIHGVLSEKRTAKRIGARTQIASGALAGVKGDMTLRGFLIEAKSTVNASISVTLDWLCKITGEAERVTKDPALTVTFVTADGRPRPDGSWVMIPERLFKELIDGRVVHEGASSES